jgi:dethiobiotin synthetase
MTSLFVTSSGTDIGKTAVCCRLLDELPAGFPVRCNTPVATGFADMTIDAQPSATASDSETTGGTALEATDTARLLAAQRLPVDLQHIEQTSPWRYRAALSADMAAAREGKTIPFDTLVDFCHAPADVRLNLIEGIGGVMAPLDGRHTVLDWIAALACPAWLVVGSYLGTLSHTLTALQALKSRGIAVGAIVVSQSLDEPVPTDETVATLARFCATTPVATLPRVAPAEPILAPLLNLTT